MRKRALAILAHGVKSVALGGVFVGATALGVVVHADMKVMKKVVVSIANDAIASLFQGRLAIGELEQLSLGTTGRVRVSQAEITDPEGHRVILAKGIDARIDLVRLVRSVAGGGTPEVFLDSASIDEVDVALDFDPRGEIGIARAFLPRPDTKPKPTPTSKSPLAEDVRLSIKNAYVHHAHVVGNVVPPKLDADGDDVHANLFIFDNRFTVKVDDARATMRSPRIPGQQGDVHGSAKGELGIPLSGSRKDIVMHWDLVGDAATIPLTAHLGLERDRLTGTVDVAPVEAAIVKRAFPIAPLSRGVEAHAKIDGELTKPLTVNANGRVGDASFTAVGELGLEANQPFHVDADLARVDAAAFAGPSSDVSGHVHAEGALGGGGPAGTFTATTKEGNVSGQSVPAITAEGHFDAKRVDASFRASEPGVDADGELTVHVPEQTLAFDVRARSKDLRRLARAPNRVAGSGSARATGTIDLARATIAAHVTADGAGVGHAPASAASVHAEADVSGPLADPVVDVTASAKQIRLTAPSADPTAPEKEPLTYPSATAHARVVMLPVPRLIEPRVHVDSSERGASIDATAREVRIAGGGVDVRGGQVKGLGAPLEMDVQVHEGATSVRVLAQDVDPKRLAAMTGVAQLRMLPEGSRAAIDVDVKSSATRSDGHVDVKISGAKDGSHGELHAKVDGRRVSARGGVAFGALGWVEVAGDELELPAGLSKSSIERATGVVDLRGEIDLAQGAALFGGESIERIAGTALVSARIERGDAKSLPTVQATASTRGLDVTFNKEGRSTHVGGIDLAVHVGYDGPSDETQASLLTWDAKGVVGSADLASRIPLAAWVTGAKPITLDAIGKLEVAGIVDVPRRDVADLPGILARPDLRGMIAMHAELGGSVAHPAVTLVARGDEMAERKQETLRGVRYAPIDGLLQARWDGRDVVATLTIDEKERPHVDMPKLPIFGLPPPKERPSGHVRGLFIARAPVADLLAGRPLAWDGSAELDVEGLELAPLPLPMNVRGALTGRLKLRDFTTDPVLDMRAHVDELGIGGARIARGDIKIEAKNGSLRTNARVTQADGGTGRVKVVSSSLNWRGTTIAWDDTKPTSIDYTLDRFRLSILRPLVRRAIPEIDGRVDGKGSATVDANTHVFEGGVALSEGRIYVNAIGEEISDLGAVATFERDGAFRVKDVTGKVGAGEIKASASGRFKGLRFESAEAVVVVPSKDGVPVSSEGATFAQATGEMKLSAMMAPDRSKLLVTADVPRAKVTIPNRTTQNLQSLEPDETVAIGIHRPDGTLAVTESRRAPTAKSARDGAALAAVAAEGGVEVEPPPPPLVTRFTVVLGREVELEGRGLKLGLGGRTVAEIADEIAVTGQINLKNGGTIDVQGRKFVVDRGTVTFVAGEDPADPIVIAAAFWDSPDRTRVWVEFNGPLKTGKLTLRSEPPYSKNEILSILLFGRADPNAAPAGDRPSDAQQATAIGAGVASSGLNKALGELDEDFDLEQDRTSANRVRTKVGYRLRRNLKVQIGYASGFSTRELDTTYLFLEWQFIPQWSLIGTRGDKGTSIFDVLFQHRY